LKASSAPVAVVGYCYYSIPTQSAPSASARTEIFCSPGAPRRSSPSSVVFVRERQSTHRERQRWWTKTNTPNSPNRRRRLRRLLFSEDSDVSLALVPPSSVSLFTFFFGRQIIIQEGDEKQLERVGDKWKKKEIYIKSYRERLLRIETTKDAREEEEEEEEEEYA
jgi:hypothetical protein